MCVHWKIRLLGGRGGHDKSIQTDCLKEEEGWTACRFKSGAG